ncbi:ubiquitin-60S ribosomal protein L40-like [Chanos chanos]|uniref:Ubiquitin-60S ribosomal protein L40-like n=1 Tax=Chanos chanos TaxID=29144 RepID=A0A6J2VTQ9_CHACN|nr:ubiquitin-60S ribosomal protein L40-like [Chanos chanos]
MGKIYQVFVVGLTGERKTVDVAHSEVEFNNTTVLEFKKKLSEKLPWNSGNDLSLMRLLFADGQLDDADKFSDHEIKDRSTIFLVLRLPGGVV